MVLVSGGITQPLVKIYTSAGVQLAVFIWDKGRIEAMGWTSEEDLMIVEQTGEVGALTAVYMSKAVTYGSGHTQAGSIQSACINNITF